VSIKIVPLSSVNSNQVQVTALDGVDFIIRVLWNERSGRHFMTVRDAANNDLITARKLVADIPWAQHDNVDGVPAGQLWTRRPDGTGVDPGLRELNENVFLMYVEEDSVT